MTEEQKKAFFQGAHIEVKGDLVNVKNVGTEINNMVEGAMQVQNNYMNLTNKNATKIRDNTSQKDSVKIKKGTFTYIYYDDDQGQTRLRVLFQYLQDSCGWLTQDAGYKEWNDLFSGQDREGTLVWTGQQSQLKFLFKYMLESGIVVNKSGLGPFEILGSHFKKPNDTLFTNWNDIKKPAKRDENALREMAKFLNINIEIDLTDSLISTYVKTRAKRY